MSMRSGFGFKDANVTLEEAAAILNAHRHHGHSKWRIAGSEFVYGQDRYECFEPFEAIAIAKAYVSELRKPTPPTLPAD